MASKRTIEKLSESASSTPCPPIVSMPPVKPVSRIFPPKIPKENEMSKTPEYPFLVESITFVQEAHTASLDRSDERLTVEVVDNGAGFFYVLKTNQFAIDGEGNELSMLEKKMQDICASNDAVRAIRDREE